MYKGMRRYITRYNPTGGLDNEPCWEIIDRRHGGVIEGGYTQEGARQAAHYHNHRHFGDAYTRRNRKR